MTNYKKPLAITTASLLGISAVVSPIPFVEMKENTAKAITREEVQIVSDTSTLKILKTSKIEISLTSSGNYSIHLLPNRNSVFYGGSGNSANASVYVNQPIPTSATYPQNFTSMTTKSFTINSKKEIELVKEDSYFEYTMRVSIANPTSEGGYLKVEMEARNKTSSVQNVAISFNMDTQVNGSDSSPFRKQPNYFEAFNNGVQVNAYFKDTFGITNADYIFLGKYNEQVPRNPNYYTDGVDIYPGDSGAGIYYEQKTVQPNQSRKESFMIGLGAKNNNPELTVTPIDKSTYWYGEVINVQGTLKDIDVGDKVTLYYGLNGENPKELTTITANGSNQSFNVNVQLPKEVINVVTNKLQIWAEDELGGMTKAYEKNFTYHTMNQPQVKASEITSDSAKITWDKGYNADGVNYELKVVNDDRIIDVGKNFSHLLTGLKSGTTYRVTGQSVAPTGVKSGFYGYPTSFTTLVNDTESSFVTDGRGNVTFTTDTSKNSENVTYTYIFKDVTTGNIVSSQSSKEPVFRQPIATDRLYEVYLEIKDDTFKAPLGAKLLGTIYEDTIAPTKPTITVDKKEITNKDVTASIEYTEDSKDKKYRIDGGEWLDYTEPIVINKNSKIEARGIDKAGNASDISSYTITNIDKIAPDNPEILSSNENPTNQDITVNINYSSDSRGKKYRIDGGEWLDYTVPLEITKNCKIEAKGIDEATNESEIMVYNVENIDKVAPENPIISADTILPVNHDVKVNVSYSEDSVIRKYRINGGEWLDYNGELTISENSKIEAKSYDNAGNVTEITSYDVSNIDRIAPNIPTINVSESKPTNKNVKISINYTEDSVNKKYKIDDGEWLDYIGEFEVDKNSKVEAKGIDNATNESEIAIKNISNIDKEPPNNPTIKSNNESPTNKNLVVTIDYTEDSLLKKYRINGGEWLDYTNPLTIEENSTIEAYGQDDAGNDSEVTKYVISNIDKEAPINPIIVPETTNPTNQDVNLNVVYSNDSVIKKYRIDGGEWLDYEGTIIADKNIKLEVQSFDNAGNSSEIIEYNVSNIDKIAPNNPEIKPENTQPTNKNVNVEITYSNDSVIKQYRIDEGEWKDYTEELIFEKNGKVEARSYDNAGNVSETVEYSVTNIDKIAPDSPTITSDNENPTNKPVKVHIDYSTDSVIKEYRIDGGKWLSYTEDLVIDDNATIEARSYDNADNVSDISTYYVTNIDKIAPENPIISSNNTKPTNQNVLVNIQYSEDSLFKMYRINSGEWLNYNGDIEIPENSIIEAISYDNATNESEIVRYSVSNIDKIAPVIPKLSQDIEKITNKNVNVSIEYSESNSKKEYKIDDGEWTEYTGIINLDKNSVVYAREIDDANNISEVGSISVENIDKSVPNVPIITTNTTAPTNEDVTVTINSQHKIFYKIDEGEWIEYVTPFKVDKNSKITSKVLNIAGTESKEVNYLVTNIDKEPPTINYSLSNAEPTNQDIYINTNAEDNVEVKKFLYAVGNVSEDEALENNQEVNENKILVEKNKEITLVAIDSANNITRKVIKVDNIDKTPPELPEIVSSNEKPTNKNVDFAINYSDDSAQKLYKIGEFGDWLEYTDKITLEYNNTIYAKAVDSVGNETEEVVYKVTNIDKEPPNLPVIKFNTIEPTNKNVTVTINSSDLDEDIEKIEYQLEGSEDWITYSSPFEMDKNMKIKSRIIDTVGNISDEVSRTISNIDKEPPALDVIKSTENPTNKDVDLTVETSDNVGIKKVKYLLGDFEENEVLEKGFETSNNGKITTSENAVFTIVSLDTAGNTTRKVIKVDNINKVKPNTPEILASTKAPTNQNVDVEIIYPENAVEKYYKFKKEDKWLKYEGKISVPENTYIYAMAVDNATNESNIAEYYVGNIDRIAPEKPEISLSNEKVTNQNLIVTLSSKDSSEKLEYRLDGGDWIDYKAPFELDKNMKIEYKATDLAGNVTEVYEKIVDNIDKVNPELSIIQDIEEMTNKDVTLTVTAKDNYSIDKIYYLDSKGTLEDVLANGQEIKNDSSVVLKENKTVTFVVKDTAGNYTLVEKEIKNIDKVNPLSPKIELETKEMVNRDLNVTIKYPDDSVNNYYKIGDSKEWLKYEKPLVIKENTDVFAYSEDSVGNISETVKETITNIDKEVPTSEVQFSTRKLTNKNVLFSLDGFDNHEVKEVKYLLGDFKETKVLSEGNIYLKPVEISENTLVSYTVEDVAGNVFYNQEKIDNIDKSVPFKPIIKLDKLNNVACGYLVTIKYPKNMKKNEYLIDTQNKWLLYKDKFTIDCGEKVYARTLNEAGTYSEVNVEISDIENPKKPETPETPVIEPVEKPKEVKQDLPKTGQENNNPLTLYGLLALISSYFMFRRK